MPDLIRSIQRFVLGAVVLPLSALAATSPTTHEYTLDNGLKLIVREDTRAPVVVSQLWYKVGGSYETAGFTGLSHALEHMMFKGTDKLDPGEGSRILRELGAEENAFTSDDFTAYYQVLAADRLPVAFELEADRLRSLQLPEDEFLREIEVIKEERRLRTEDRPNALAYERFKTLAYPASGYRNPVIGWMHDLDRMTVEDLRDWHQAWYAPNNATLVVVGDVRPEEVKALAETHFGDIPARPIRTSKLPKELEAPGERRTTLYLKTQLPSLIMGFNTPGLASADDQRQVYALQLAAAILDGGYSARLPSKLEREAELVSGASVWFDGQGRGDGLFILSATPNIAKGHTLAEVEAGLWAEIKTLQDTPVEPQELARVRAQVIAALVYARDSITGQASAIGSLESVGLSWRLLDQELEMLESISAEDIQQAAQHWLTPERLTVAYVLPEEERP